jgi:hypothetical protein
VSFYGLRISSKVLHLSIISMVVTQEGRGSSEVPWKEDISVGSWHNLGWLKVVGRLRGGALIHWHCALPLGSFSNGGGVESGGWVHGWCLVSNPRMARGMAHGGKGTRNEGKSMAGSNSSS